MIMNRILNKIVWLIILIPLAYLGIIWKKLQEKVPMHFGVNGEPDRFGDKTELLTAVCIICVASGLIFLLLKNIYRIDPKRYAAENKDRLLRIGFAVTVFMSAISCMMIYSGIKGASAFNVSIILSSVGLLFAIIGNYLPNLKPNYFAGLRLPWTLENPDNWKRTHALAGKLWFVGGLALAVICLLLPGKIALITFFSVMMIITIIPCVYSFNIYKNRKKKNEINN